eukprot:gb/GECG01008185.1/.p1 GENE.gb/GECG01008185.1/~~gb/GECG01008185.1/.p1  ORF type:complete len:590 (+),score=53.91 gb/GECG01008185.1/:1-1770(+)
MLLGALCIAGYVGFFFALGLTLAGASLPDWITYKNDAKVELGMWRSCFKETCNARSDYNWGYGRHTSVGYMRQGLLSLRALFLIQIALLFYFISVPARYDYGSIRGSFARNRLRVSYFALLFFSLMTSIWPAYLNGALDGNDIDNKEVGVGWINQIVSTVVVLLLLPSGWLAIPKSPAGNQPALEDAKGGQVVDTWDEQQSTSRKEKLKQFLGKPAMRNCLVLFSFVCYMTALGSPQWSVTQTEKEGESTQNEYVGPWSACCDGSEAPPAMTCSEPYTQINRDEFSVLATTQTLSMIGALLLIGEVLMIYAASNRIVEAKKARFFFLWFVLFELISVVLVAASWGREFVDLYSIEKKNEGDDDESKHFGVGWSLLWPTFVFQILLLISGLSWKASGPETGSQRTADSQSSSGTEDFEMRNKDRAIALLSSVCCCSGGQKGIKILVYVFGFAAFIIQLTAMGTSKWMRVKFNSEDSNYDVDVGPALACVTKDPSTGVEWSLCSTSIMGLLDSEQFPDDSDMTLKRVFDDGADVATAVNASLAFGAASIVSVVLALLIFVIRAARVFSYERMSKAVVHSFHMSCMYIVTAV